MSSGSLSEKLVSGDRLTINEIHSLCQKIKEILCTEENLVHLNAPIVVCGDIHGQFEDLIHIFRCGGRPPYANYLFMGDYVDRGPRSVEVISLLFALKLEYPGNITILRGNHECREVTRRYGFYDECMDKYGDSRVWKYFTDAFDFLPLSAVIDGRIFCMHGGLSPDISSLDQVSLLDRRMEIPFYGPMTDLVWSDPHTARGWNESSRGAGYLFGKDVTLKFNKTNNLDFIARAHQVAESGYHWDHDHSIVTIFSASNYCGQQGNQGAVMEIEDDFNLLFHRYYNEEHDVDNYDQELESLFSSLIDCDAPLLIF